MCVGVLCVHVCVYVCRCVCDADIIHVRRLIYMLLVHVHMYTIYAIIMCTYYKLHAHDSGMGGPGGTRLCFVCVSKFGEIVHIKYT